MTDDSLEALVETARGGDRAALDALVRRIQQPIFALAVRMLWHRQETLGE